MKTVNPPNPMVERCDEAAHLLKSLAHPLRLELLCHLSAGELSVSELEELSQGSQSQVSQYLGRMKNEGLLDCRRDGKRVYYRIQDPRTTQLIRSMHGIFCPKDRK